MAFRNTVVHDRFVTIAVASLALGLVPLLAHAVDLQQTPPPPSTIVGGNFAQTCEWPGSVDVPGCSATLVHPQVILYAAHCGGAPTVRFGEDGNDPALTINTTYCRDNPDYSGGVPGTDFAYCLLSQPVTEVPAAPVLMGCERDQLQVGSRALMVGFGRQTAGGPEAPGPSAMKKWLDVPVAGFPNEGRLIGLVPEDPDTGICFGDSGGSVYFQLEDGSWRSIGINATIAGATCPGSSQHTPMWNVVEWVEQDSGIDITPCHDADGTWNPGPECTGAPMGIDSGEGLDWGSQCSGGPMTGFLSTCGPAFGEPPDDVPPTVVFVNPDDGASFTEDYVEMVVEISVEDPEGYGYRDVEFFIDGESMAILEEGPYEIDASFPVGTWELRAEVLDWSNNVGEAIAVIEVGAQPETTGSSSGGDESTSSGGSDESTTSGGESTTTGSLDESSTGGPPGQDEGDSGCGCRYRAGGSAVWILWLGLLLSRRRTNTGSRGTRWRRSVSSSSATRSPPASADYCSRGRVRCEGSVRGR